jgi:hypothetical protein
MSVSSASADVDSICILSFLGGMVDRLGARTRIIDCWYSRNRMVLFEGGEAAPEIKMEGTIITPQKNNSSFLERGPG